MRFVILGLLLVFIIGLALYNRYARNEEHNKEIAMTDENGMSGENQMSYKNGVIPQELETIPEEYFEEADRQGTIEQLNYETYEAFSYYEKNQKLSKTAYVYLPYGYDKSNQYDVFYLMHGGWSNETNYLGTTDEPHDFKNILDHAIEDGKIEPLIVVCPTYNNTSGEDSGDYSLALQLTDLYHQELVNDLIPAVESKYHTFAEDVSVEGQIASRNHRGFGGFSMGSVTTWRTFEHCLDEFRYFMPSSGNVGNGSVQDQVVADSNWNWDDFFIFTASGTDDFAYSSFKSQVMNMSELPSDNFRMSDTQAGGNLSFREREGATHDYLAALEYIYNGMQFFWNGNSETTNTVNESIESTKTNTTEYFSLSSTVSEVEEDPAFEEFGNLLFPVDRNVSQDMTLEELSSSSVYVWYSNIQPDKTVEIVNTLKADAEAGNQIFYNIYSKSEMETDPSKRDTGLFFFRGNPGEKYAIMNAGGGFMYVGAMHDSFPHALEVSKQGYNSFALIYRPDSPYEDLAAAISFITDHAEELQVDPESYSLWGGSAGARMAATLGNRNYLSQLTGRTDVPQASAVIMQYTGYNSVSAADAPTYACVGNQDGIANWNTMKTRLNSLEGMGIPTEFHVYEGLSHGFGIGSGTVAEGWLNDAVEFWEKNM